MSVQQDVINRLKLSKGQSPMSAGQLRRRIHNFTESVWPWSARERDPDGYALWKEGMLATLVEAEVNFAFNYELAGYRSAVERLAQVELSVRREAYEVGTGQFESDPVTGEPVEIMQTIAAITPLVAEDVEYPVFDEETGEQTGTVTEPDREVVARLEKDAVERAAAQAVIDVTSQEVKDFEV